MSRVIAGRIGGRRFRVPAGQGTRPTSDRVREALFSALEAEFGSLRGLSFLDLYAGSGGIALEAWSRGAERVVAVERDRRAAGVIRSNARELGVPLVVDTRSVGQVLVDQTSATAFDVVFLDPPYATAADDIAETVTAVVTGGWLDAEGIVVVETTRRIAEPAWPPTLARWRRREYGETVLWYLRRDPSTMGGPSAPGPRRDGIREHNTAEGDAGG